MINLYFQMVVILCNIMPYGSIMQIIMLFKCKFATKRK